MTELVQLTLDGMPVAGGDVRDTWQTPRDLVSVLEDEFGKFVIDLAASKLNAIARRHYTVNDNALTKRWPRKGWCFLNPPFSLLREFISKVWEETKRGSHVVVVVPGHRHEQAWFHKYVLGKASEVRCPRGRIAYDAPPGVKRSTPGFPSMVLIYRPNWPGKTILQELIP